MGETGVGKRKRGEEEGEKGRRLEFGVYWRRGRGVTRGGFASCGAIDACGGRRIVICCAREKGAEVVPRVHSCGEGVPDAEPRGAGGPDPGRV